MTSTAGNIVFNIRYTIEYDGFIEMAFSVIPFWSYAKDFKSVAKLNGLYFEFPFHNEEASLFHFWPNGESGIIPDPTIMASGAVPKEGVDCLFKPYFWTGWEFGGLGIATESDENIQLVAGTPCITLKNYGDRKVLRWNLFNKVPRQWNGRVDLWTDALASIDYVFGLQATPVKEIPANRTDIRIVHDRYDCSGDSLKPDENGENTLDKYQKVGANWVVFHEPWSVSQNYGQAENEELFRTYVEECHKRGMKVMAYFGYEYATNAPEWYEQKNNYLIINPRGNYVGGWQRNNPWQRAYMVCYRGGYAKKLRERVAYGMDNYGFDGIYTDGTYIPWECANPHHGCGYLDENGVRHSTFPIFAVREHVKALYQEVHIRGGIIDTHQSSCMVAPTLAFADTFYNGESIQAKLKEDFLNFLNLEAYRTEFMGKNLGLYPQLLASVDCKMSIEKFNSLSIIHDSLPRPQKPEDAAYVGCFWKEMSAFDTGHADWHPYWADNSPVKVDIEQVYCSVYEKDGEYLAALSSFNVDVDQVVLTFDTDVELKHTIPGETVVTAIGNQVTVNMKAFKPELIHLTKR